MTALALATTAPPFVDPQTLLDDPHARFAALRLRHPVIEIREGHYMVLRAGDVLSLPNDTRTRQIEGPEFVALNRIPDGVAARFLSDFFLFSNGEAHRAKRGLFARSLAHRAMRDLRPEIRAVADRIVASLPRGESFDFVDTMASRVPAEMIAAILGLPAEDAPYFARRVYDVALALNTIYPHDHHGRIEDAASELFDYIEQQLMARMSAPRGDLLSELAAQWRDDPAISFESLVFQVLGLIIGGSDTTRAAFAMLVSQLARREDEWRAVRDDAALIPGAVAEALRFDPSVGTFPRLTTEEMQIGRTTVPAGAMLSLSTLSAMRDPQLYDDPDLFDIRRTDHPRLHMVFGAGAHRCIGEMLARIEMEEALAALLGAIFRVEIQTAPRLIGFGGIRQITPMRVRLV